jgi:hypothetical protein
MEAGWEPLRGDGNSYLGTGAWKATRAGARVTYSKPDLPAGHYEIYRYEPGECIEPEGQYNLQDTLTGEWRNPGVHGWVYEGAVDQVRNGSFRHTRQATAPGDFADALLLIRR